MDPSDEVNVRKLIAHVKKSLQQGLQTAPFDKFSAEKTFKNAKNVLENLVASNVIEQGICNGLEIDYDRRHPTDEVNIDASLLPGDVVCDEENDDVGLVIAVTKPGCGHVFWSRDRSRHHDIVKMNVQIQPVGSIDYIKINVDIR